MRVEQPEGNQANFEKKLRLPLQIVERIISRYNQLEQYKTLSSIAPADGNSSATTRVLAGVDWIFGKWSLDFGIPFQEQGTVFEKAPSLAHQALSKAGEILDVHIDERLPISQRIKLLQIATEAFRIGMEPQSYEEARQYIRSAQHLYGWSQRLEAVNWNKPTNTQLLEICTSLLVYLNGYKAEDLAIWTLGRHATLSFKVGEALELSQADLPLTTKNRQWVNRKRQELQNSLQRALDTLNRASNRHGDQ